MPLSLSVLSSRGGLAKFKPVRKIRKLAKSKHSLEMAQLAFRVDSAMHAESSIGDDPFAKVKSLISKMISMLEDMASADATHKAYYDKKLSESQQKRSSLVSRDHVHLYIITVAAQFYCLFSFTSDADLRPTRRNLVGFFL